MLVCLDYLGCQSLLESLFCSFKYYVSLLALSATSMIASPLHLQAIDKILKGTGQNFGTQRLAVGVLLHVSVALLINYLCIDYLATLPS